MLAVSILVCGVSTQYKKAKAISIGLPILSEVASAMCPWGTVVILMVAIISPIVGAAFSTHGEDKAADDLEEIRKLGEGVWKDFKKYYWNEWVNSAEHITESDGSWEEAGQHLIDFKENAMQGCIDTTSDVWEAFLDFVESMCADDIADVRPYVDYKFNEFGCLAIENVDCYICKYLKDIGEYGYSIRGLDAEADVNIAFISLDDNPRYSPDVVLYSLKSFSARIVDHVPSGGYESMGTLFSQPMPNDLPFQWVKDGSVFFYGSYNHEKYKDDFYDYDPLYPNSCYFANWAEFYEYLNLKLQVIDLDPDPTYTLPSPYDWTWEKNQELVKPEDVPDVIVLQPDAVAEHAQNDDAVVAELERLIALALAHEIPWSQVFEYLNIDAFSEATTANPDSPSTDVPEEKPIEKPSADIPYSYSGLEKIFPFCIPFDIYKFLNLLDAKAKAPCFKWTIVVYKKKYDLTIDLKEWDKIASLFRDMELILFIIGLAMVTRSKMIRS